MLCFLWLAPIFFSPLPTAAPICVLLTIILLLAQRPCFHCTVLFLLLLLMPLYGGDNWPRWGLGSLLLDLSRHWKMDTQGRRVVNLWQGVQAVCKFLFALRPHPDAAPVVAL